MTRFSLFLLLTFAGSGPVFAQVSATAVSPALGLEDFNRPIICTGRDLCAVTSPAIGLRYSQSNQADRDAVAASRSAHRLSAALLPGPTPRPEPPIHP